MFAIQDYVSETRGCDKNPGAVLPFFPGFARVFFPALIGFMVLVGPSMAQGQAPATTSAPVVAPAASEKAAVEGSTTASARPPESGDATPAVKATAGTGSALLPHDLSPWGMFLNADIVVKAVMVGLAFASLLTWTVFLAKTLELAGARNRAARALSDLAGAPTLREASGLLTNTKAPVSRFVAAALAESERSRGLSSEGVKDRASALLSRIEARAGRAMGRGTGLLATIGSTAPFVGLFGTVWGIMNAFIGISKTNTTNLAVVAPGIAEALLATAFGLVAAIPAVIIYNMFARSITGYRSLLGDASTEVMRLLSRDLDREDVQGRNAPISRAAE